MSFTGRLGTPSSRLGNIILAFVPASAVQNENLDIFSVDPGAQAGRIEPALVAPQDGAYVFCLGHDKPAFVDWIVPGDYASIIQTDTFPAGLTAQLKFDVKGRVPNVQPPSGYSWTLTLLIDDATVSSRTLPNDPYDTSDTVIEWTSWQVDLTSYDPTAPHSIAFVMTLDGPALPTSGAGTNPYMLAEIPAFYVDIVEFASAPMSPLIENLYPENLQGLGNGPPPDAFDANPGSAPIIAFDVLTFGGAAPDMSTLSVVINGNPVVTAGTPTYSGYPYSVSVTTESYGAHVVLTPTGDWPAANETFAVTASIASPNAATTTWSFKTNDIAPPTIVGVQAISATQIRVTFSKQVLLVSAANPNDGLNPSLYSLIPVLPDTVTPAVTPVVTSVAVVNAMTSQVDLFTDIELTNGVSYLLDESLVAALNHVHLSEPQSESNPVSVQFAWTLARPPTRVFDLYRLLPLMNRQEDASQDLLRFIRCVQESASLLLTEVDNWPTILSIDLAPDAFLDAMLVDLGNPFPFVLEEIDKRRLLKILVQIYAQKGTAIGIINAVRFFLDLTITITSFTNAGYCILGVSELGVNWILGPGQSFARYSFRVNSAIALTETQVADITWIANYMKPGHTHLIEVVVPTNPPPYDPVELGISKLGVDWILHA